MKKIYILPGWAYGLDKWDEFTRKLKAIGSDPVVLKIPGLHTKIDRPWDIGDYVDWLEKKLSKEKEIILLGHSNGGRLALSYILKNPEKVSKLILIDSAGIYHNELPIRVKKLIFKYLAKTGKKFTKSDTLKNLLYKLARENDYNQAPEVMKKTMQNLISHDLSSDLDKIKAETLIIWGEDDKTTPVADGTLMSNKISKSRLVVVKEARHSPQFTNTDEVVEEIRKFI